MAANSPTGAATIIAMNEMSRVPAKRGIAPKAPEEPTWSSRIAVCGLQARPNRKSASGTWPKKRSASNSTERTMPRVVKIATVEHAIRKIPAIRSTWFRARSPGATRRQATPSPATATISTTTADAAAPVR